MSAVYHRTRARPYRLCRRRRSPLTCIDLFSGAGGLAEGFRAAGWRIVVASDSDEFAAQTFQANFPKTLFIRRDISLLASQVLTSSSGLARGELDCLLGGPPCQSFSYNNHARSASNRRAQLFRQYLRIVEDLLPKTLVMENVPGMLTIGGGAVIRAIRRKLARLGYECEARILFAEDYGVPQTRRRVFIIASRVGWDGKLFPSGSHGPSVKPSVRANVHVHRWAPRSTQCALPFETVWDAIGDLPPFSNGAVNVTLPYLAKPRSGFQVQSRRRSAAVHNHVAHRLAPKVLHRIRTVPEGGDWRDMPRRLLPSGMRRAEANAHTKRYGRLSRQGMCCTILTKCDPHWGSYIHPTQDRVISVREAARLQTFPDRFHFCGPLTRQYEQVGNAVPPAVAHAIARVMRRHLERAIMTPAPGMGR